MVVPWLCRTRLAGRVSRRLSLLPFATATIFTLYVEMSQSSATQSDNSYDSQKLLTAGDALFPLFAELSSHSSNDDEQYEMDDLVLDLAECFIAFKRKQLEFKEWVYTVCTQELIARKHAGYNSPRSTITLASRHSWSCCTCSCQQYRAAFSQFLKKTAISSVWNAYVWNSTCMISTHILRLATSREPRILVGSVELWRRS